jgi:hypothetical protein
MDVSAVGPEDDDDQLALMLSHIGKLQQLTHLSVGHSADINQMLPLEEAPGIIPAAVCAALRASSKLVHLGVFNLPVPVDGWEYVFRAGQQLPSLQQLSLECKDCARLLHADLGRLVTCCPNLQQLKLRDALRPTDVAHLQPLLSLSQLTKLYTDHPGDSLTVLPQLTGLRDLYIGTISESGLLRLSGLQQLTSLSAGLTWPEQNPHMFSMGKRPRSPSFKVIVDMQLPLLPWCIHSFKHGTVPLHAITQFVTQQ